MLALIFNVDSCTFWPLNLFCSNLYPQESLEHNLNYMYHYPEPNFCSELRAGSMQDPATIINSLGSGTNSSTKTEEAIPVPRRVKYWVDLARITSVPPRCLCWLAGLGYLACLLQVQPFSSHQIATKTEKYQEHGRYNDIKKANTTVMCSKNWKMCASHAISSSSRQQRATLDSRGAEVGL